MAYACSGLPRHLVAYLPLRRVCMKPTARRLHSPADQPRVAMDARRLQSLVTAVARLEEALNRLAERQAGQRAAAVIAQARIAGWDGEGS